MPTNDFIGFASAGSANIMTQADYAAAAEQADGVQPGPASSALANKVWRQGANMAAALGDFIKNAGYDAFDDGDLASLSLALKSAFTNIKTGNGAPTSNIDTDQTYACQFYQRGPVVVFSGKGYLLTNGPTYNGRSLFTGLPANLDPTGSAMYGAIVQDNHYVDTVINVDSGGTVLAVSRAIALNTSFFKFWGCYFAS